ncbi:hypothetical protein [Pontibacter rugosus]|uniref:Uncharacterized protein n=1 Tax=Pontibacter rugosus TaxID=1745966 RepID=A0ABW3SNY1_9BACT
MKTDKLMSKPDLKQPNNHMNAMRIPRITPVPEWPQEAPLNESHLNLMQSWLNLRGMDNNLAQVQQAKNKKKA